VDKEVIDSSIGKNYRKSQLGLGYRNIMDEWKNNTILLVWFCIK